MKQGRAFWGLVVVVVMGVLCGMGCIAEADAEVDDVDGETFVPMDVNVDAGTQEDSGSSGLCGASCTRI